MDPRPEVIAVVAEVLDVSENWLAGRGPKERSASPATLLERLQQDTALREALRDNPALGPALERLLEEPGLRYWPGDNSGWLPGMLERIEAVAPSLTHGPRPVQALFWEVMDRACTDEHPLKLPTLSLSSVADTEIPIEPTAEGKIDPEAVRAALGVAAWLEQLVGGLLEMVRPETPGELWISEDWYIPYATGILNAIIIALPSEATRHRTVQDYGHVQPVTHSF